VATEDEVLEAEIRQIRRQATEIFQEGIAARMREIEGYEAWAEMLRRCSFVLFFIPVAMELSNRYAGAAETGDQ